MSWFGKKDEKNDASNTLNEPIQMTARGVDKQVDLTATTLRITTFKKKHDQLQIVNVQEIPRNEIAQVIIKSGIMYSRYMDISHGKNKESIPIVQLDEFELIFNELDKKNYKIYMQTRGAKLEEKAKRDAEKAKRELPWYVDNTKLNHIITYSSTEEATRDADAASHAGWVPSGTSATDGHINVGRTATEAVLTGGLTLLLGASRTNGKITVTYVRTPQWLEEHNMGTKKPEVPTSNGSNDVITQLERLAKLRDQGILTEEEFQQQKTKIMNS
jgi:hypothetical protein